MHDEAITELTEVAQSEPSASTIDTEQRALTGTTLDADRPSRLPPAVAVGVMVLLLLCATLVLVAWNRAPV